MYENTKSSIDWKGLFLKVIIAFLIIIIAVKGISLLKGNNKKDSNNTTNAVAETKASSTFTANIAKLKEAGEKYYSDNKDKLPKTEGTTTMVTLNELISNGNIDALADEDGKTCDGESSYVTAILEGNKTKLKANLVCGESSSYSLVYMGENDAELQEETSSNETTTSTNTSSSKTSTSTSSSTKKTSTTNTNTSSNNCTSNSCTPSVTVNTNTNVSQNVSINTDKKNNTTDVNNNIPNKEVKNNIYTVSFDANGGTKSYRTQYVEAYDNAVDPGNNYKSGYTFKGWYLDGEEFDFDTPIARNITLVAKYRKTTSYENLSDSDYSDYTKYTTTSSVSTMGWFKSGTDYVKISHTLKVPEKILDLDNIDEIRIANITFGGAIDTTEEATNFYAEHYDTFFYAENEYDSRINRSGIFSTIRKSDVSFRYNTDYKSFRTAKNEGFDVTWIADEVYEQCERTFEVNGVDNLCDYGIYYFVTWEYIRY